MDPGHVLAGRYQLVAPLGSGGVGTVWLARDEMLNRRVAVKEFSPPVGVDRIDRELFRLRTFREARTAARLRHPNVVTIYDVMDDGSRPWIVMEFVPAISLNDLVRERGPLNPRQAATVGLQVLAALRAAHEVGILHRDVKPGNVLIESSGRAVLADFGIARAQDSPALTASGVLLGSPSYMSPERARGEPAGPEADLWSLGATLYAVVEGRSPFDRGSALATLTAVVTQSPDPPRRCGALWPAISGLLRKDPARRLDPATAAEMLRQVADRAPHNVPAACASSSEAATARWAGPRPVGQAPRPAEPVSDLTFQLAMVRELAGTAPPAQEPAGQEPVPPAEHARAGRASPGRRWLFRLISAGAVLSTVAGILLIFATPIQPSVSPGLSAHTSTTGASAASGPGVRRTGPGARERAPREGAGEPQRVLAGYHLYRDPSGFSIAVPDGWSVAHQGGYVYLGPPGGTIFLVIGQTGDPPPDPLADLRQHEASWRALPGYHRIRLEGIRYPHAEKAADLEFTYDRRDVLTHVLIRLVRVSAQQAYALYWSAPEGAWDQSRPVFQILASTFQPAAPQPQVPDVAPPAG